MPGKRLSHIIKHTILFVISLVFVVLLAACQPTPSKPAVINKNDGQLEAAIQATATFTTAVAPSGSNLHSAAPEPAPAQHITVQFPAADEKVMISVDADLLKPDMPIPVIRLQPKVIEMDMVKQAVNVLFQGNPANEPRVGMTKGELQTEILKCQQFISNWDTLVAYYGGGKEGEACAKTVTDEFTQRIKEYQKQLALAPETMERKPTDWVFHPKSYYEDMTIYGDISGNDAESIDLRDIFNNSETIQLESDMNGYVASMDVYNLATDTQENHYLTFILGKHGVNGSVMWDEADNQPMTLTCDQVAAMATDTIHALGLTDYVLCSVGIVKNRMLTDNAAATQNISNPTATAGDSDVQNVYGYNLSFVPVYRGIPAGDASMSRISKDEQAVGPRVPYEKLIVRIRNDRIVGLNWGNPSDIIKVENENVRLLSIDDIMASFQTYMKNSVTLDWLSRDGSDKKEHEALMDTIQSGEISINKIEMTLWRMRIKDQPRAYRIIPVWRFYGSESLKYKDGRSAAYSAPNDTIYAWINGLDGSVFDAGKGY